MTRPSLADIEHALDEAKDRKAPQGRYQMRPEQLSDDLTYRNYKYNRLASPDTTPQQWKQIYGERVTQMERRFQLDRER